MTSPATSDAFDAAEAAAPFQTSLSQWHDEDCEWLKSASRSCDCGALDFGIRIERSLQEAYDAGLRAGKTTRASKARPVRFAREVLFNLSMVAFWFGSAAYDAFNKSWVLSVINAFVGAVFFYCLIHELRRRGVGKKAAAR